HIKPFKVVEGSPQMQISAIDYSSYVGRIAVGRITRGTLNWGENVSLVKKDGSISKNKIKEIYTFEGLGKEKIKTPVPSGEICAILGMDGFDIGDTIADFENPEGLKSMAVDEPTMSMLFTINNSPFFGQDGQYVTSRHLKERLMKEIEKNLALRVEESGTADAFIVFGRGILHLSILIETMRREGFELQLGQPKVIVKEINGKKHEPVEVLTVNVPESMSGKVIEQVSMRKGELLTMETKNDRVNIEFHIPSRGLIGLRNKVLTATEGEAIMAHRFKAFLPWKGDMQSRRNGSLIAMDAGTSIPYSLHNLQDRGKFFINAGEEIYGGQVVGENNKQEDMIVKVTKTKKLSNVRAAGTDEKMHIAPAIKFSLEEALEYIKEDEYLEVTPKIYRMRKILLNEHDRKRAAR
ncbi:MAG: translational GTPase TypA, partial [Bacteroidetes bacterium]|nr:translational GTPase TypA [Bacteroidota bacterium]